MQNFAKLWAPLVTSVESWMKVTELQGQESMRQAYLDTLHGDIRPDQGLILKP
jgi:hypothetical protein